MREIFSLATTGGARDQSLPSETDGLTLDELQRIGQEAGIEPAQIAQAAMRLDARGMTAPARRSFGLPVGVSRVVDLPRAPTVLMSAVVAAAGNPTKALAVLGMFGGMAVAAFGVNLVRLPRWARERERQMELIAERAVKLLSNPKVDPRSIESTM